MNDWASIFTYGLLGWLVFTDIWLIIIGIYAVAAGNRNAIPQPLWWFFGRRLGNIGVGIVATLLYKDGVLGFLWTVLLACAVSYPEMAYQIWQAIRPKSDDAPGPQAPE